MDIVFLPQHLVALVVFIIIIVSLVVAVMRKWMITYALLISNLIVFVLTMIFMDQILGSFNETALMQGKIVFDYAGLGFRPLYLSVEYLPQNYTLFTSMFIHGGFVHIFGNMLVLFFVGVAFEQRVGWKKFLVIYLITGVVGALAHSIFNLDFPNQYVTLIGASGAIFGIMGAFAFAYPRDEVVMPIPLGFFMIMRRIKVIYAVLLFAVLETIIVFIDVNDNTAHFAHLGGLVAGVVLAAILIRRKKVGGTATSETMYYDSYAQQHPRDIDFPSLKKFAITPELRDMLKKIENETVPQVRDIWLEHFFEKAVCPRCGKSLNHFNQKIWCDSCGFKSKY